MASLHVVLDTSVLLSGNIPALRDAADQPVLGTLLAALDTCGADYLITGDKDLLVLAAHDLILTLAQFWTFHGDL